MDEKPAKKFNHAGFSIKRRHKRKTKGSLGLNRTYEDQNLISSLVDEFDLSQCACDILTCKLSCAPYDYLISETLRNPSNPLRHCATKAHCCPGVELADYHIGFC